MASANASSEEAASANASSEEAHLNHIQRRCLAVLRGGRAGDELKAAATTMLKTGEASKREENRQKVRETDKECSFSMFI